MLALNEINRYAKRFEELKSKDAAFKSNDAKYRELLEQVKQFIQGLGMSSEGDMGKLLSNIVTHVNSYAVAMQEFTKVEEKKAAFEQIEDVERLVALSEPKEELSLEVIVDQLDMISIRVEELFKIIQSYGEQLEGLQRAWDDIRETETEMHLPGSILHPDHDVFNLAGYS